MLTHSRWRGRWCLARISHQGAVMIAEDFGPVVHNGHVRVLATESIAGTTVEGACARTGPCVHGAKRPARARPAQSAIGTIIDTSRSN